MSPRPSNESDRDGPHSSSMPVVPWPNATIGQPPDGGSPVGVKTEPDTTVSLPESPLVE